MAGALDPSTPDRGQIFVEQMADYAAADIVEVHVMPFGDDPVSFINGLGRYVTPQLGELN